MCRLASRHKRVNCCMDEGWMNVCMYERLGKATTVDATSVGSIRFLRAKSEDGTHQNAKAQRGSMPSRARKTLSPTGRAL